MNMFSERLLFMLCFVNLTQVSVSLKKVPCNYDDEECVTKSTNAFYPKTVMGRPGQVEASDPLIQDVIDLKMYNLHCTLYNATLKGMLKCSVTDVKINKKKVFFNYKLECPKLQIESEYKLKGKLNDVSVQGFGASNIIYKNYDINLIGYYRGYLDMAADLHTDITDFKLKLSVGEVRQEWTGNAVPLNVSGNVVASANLQKNLAELEEKIREPMMYSFMNKYVKNLNDLLKIVPIKDIQYQME